jgi:phage virion morphogenesis protein
MVDIRVEGLDRVNRELKRLKRKVKNLKPFYDKAKFIMFKDIIRHFVQERSPKGKWKRLKSSTLKARRAGKGHGTKVLQDTGKLKQVTPFSSRKTAIVGTNLKYAKTHNFGDTKRKIPKREFMWLSDRAGKQILGLMEKHLIR